jgi:hypothetical protein
MVIINMALKKNHWKLVKLVRASLLAQIQDSKLLSPNHQGQRFEMCWEISSIPLFDL